MKINIYLIRNAAQESERIISLINGWDKAHSKHIMIQAERLDDILSNGNPKPDIIIISGCQEPDLYIQHSNNSVFKGLYTKNLLTIIHASTYRSLELSKWIPHTIDESDLLPILNSVHDSTYGSFLNVKYKGTKSSVRFDCITSISCSSDTSEKNYIAISTGRDSIKSKMALRDMEKILPSYFYRISRFDIINTSKVISVVGEQIRMKDGSVVYASRKYMAGLQEYLLGV